MAIRKVFSVKINLQAALYAMLMSVVHWITANSQRFSPYSQKFPPAKETIYSIYALKVYILTYIFPKQLLKPIFFTQTALPTAYLLTFLLVVTYLEPLKNALSFFFSHGQCSAELCVCACKKIQCVRSIFDRQYFRGTQNKLNKQGKLIIFF